MRVQPDRSQVPPRDGAVDARTADAQPFGHLADAQVLGACRSRRHRSTLFFGYADADLRGGYGEALAWSLFDVRDAEALVAGIANRDGGDLSFHDREDLQQFLLVECWQLSERFEPGRGVSFSTYATTTLRRRVTDSNRGRLGRTVWKFRDRTYERQLPQLVSYEREFHHAHGRANGSDASGDDERPSRRLGRALAELSVDGAAHSDPALARVVATRSSATPPHDHPIREPGARRAA